MTINITAYKALYLETGRKLIEEYTDIKSTSETQFATQNLLRIFHSLKGQSLAMGYNNIASLSLLIETFCRTLSDSKIPFVGELVSSLPSPKIFLEDLDNIDKTNEEISLSKDILMMQKLLEEIKNKQLSILVVEDDTFFQKLCIDKLREKLVLVDFANDGEDAIARMTAKKYDCVLLDIIMPKKNGFDVLQHAKENGILPSTPFIVFSTLGQEENIQKAIAMGAIDFVNKADFDFNLLMSKIETVVHKS